MGPWVRISIHSVEQRLRWVPPGSFRMGSPDSDGEAHERERPQHWVSLARGYWMFDTPCTQAMWTSVVGGNPSRFKGDDQPVESVTWHDCQAFLKELNVRLPNSHFRLPREAEWEYACRAGSETVRYGEDLNAIAWWHSNSNGQARSVGLKKPNAWGLYDMLGNVYEWCEGSQRTFDANHVNDRVEKLDSRANRGIRGGGWHSNSAHVRAAYRYWRAPGVSRVTLGFRALSSGQEPSRAA